MTLPTTTSHSRDPGRDPPESGGERPPVHVPFENRNVWSARNGHPESVTGGGEPHATGNSSLDKDFEDDVCPMSFCDQEKGKEGITPQLLWCEVGQFGSLPSYPEDVQRFKGNLSWVTKGRRAGQCRPWVDGTRVDGTRR